MEEAPICTGETFNNGTYVLEFRKEIVLEVASCSLICNGETFNNGTYVLEFRKEIVLEVAYVLQYVLK